MLAPEPMRGNRIAVIGAGVSGLSAAWMLSRHHPVTLFEANNYLGGHSNTVDATVDGVTAPVDTGFLVFNDRTYPNLVALFEHLGVPHCSSEMSFSVRVDEEKLEWAGNNLATVFAQKRNLVNLEFWRMLKEILRFNRESTQALLGAQGCEGTLGEFFRRRGYGRAFQDWYLLPMSGAIWSCPTRQMLEYPAQTFFRFCHNHGLLSLSNRPLWRTVRGGAREYVRRLVAGISDVRSASPVDSVTRTETGVRVVTGRGGAEHFSQVVFACHSDQALRILGDATNDERTILGAVRYQANHAVLHTDSSLLPRSREAWAAWNYVAGSSGPEGRPVSVSYLLNRLQPLPFSRPVLVTLNPTHEPRPETVIRRFDYAHPVFDTDAISAQQCLPEVQGRNNTWYCGAWTGFGFHEDGLNSALAVVNAMGIKAPWQGSAAAVTQVRGAA
jgi:uncharacterized protein